MTIDENRRHQRIEFEFRIHDKTGKGPWMTEDISVGGCFLKALESMLVGSEIDLFFRIPGSSRYVEVSAEVKHVQEGGMGIEFIDMGNKAKEEVDRFVQHVYQFIGKHA